MTPTDSLIRQPFIEACVRFGVNVTTLSKEVRGGFLNISGMVPSNERRHYLPACLEHGEYPYPLYRWQR